MKRKCICFGDLQTVFITAGNVVFIIKSFPGFMNWAFHSSKHRQEKFENRFFLKNLKYTDK